MSDPAMKQFEQEFYRLYGDGAYAAAYDLATREMGRFPTWAQSSYYNWRMCAACLMGQPELALALFAEALAAGHWYDEAGLREDAIDVFRPDLARNGISQIRKFAALAEANYIAVAPYHDGGPIGTAAALHLAASLPNFFIQQVPLPDAAEDRRFRAELAGAGLEAVTEGYLNLPVGPGLGIQVNTSLLGKEVA